MALVLVFNISAQIAKDQGVMGKSLYPLSSDNTGEYQDSYHNSNGAADK